MTAALEDLKALIDLVAKDTGALLMKDPDEDSVGSTLEGDLEMTFGHVRRANEALSVICGYTEALNAISETVPSGHLDYHKPKYTGYEAFQIARTALENKK